MAQIDGRQPVIIKLADDSTVTGVQASTFDEAFGYSEFRGKGRARRVKRKAARQTKKMTRVANKVARKTAKKVGRQQVKTARIAAKSAKKDTRLQGRLNRKTLRQASRDRAEDEIPEMEDTALPIEDLQFDPTDQEAVGEANYSEPRYNRNTETAEDADYSEEAESDYEQSPSEDEDGYEGDDNYIGDDDAEAMFNGEEKESSFNAENENPATIVKIGPAVMDKARRLYWNELMENRIQNKISNAEGDPMELAVSLDATRARIQELESELEGYSNARGGGRAQAKAARQEVKAAKKAVRQEARAARKEAKVERQANKVTAKAMPGPLRRVLPQIPIKRILPQIPVRRPAPIPPPPVEVDEELDAETSDNYIEVPAEDGSNFDGDGISGTKSRIKFKHVAIAFGIGLALFAAYKYSTTKGAGVKA